MTKIDKDSYGALAIVYVCCLIVLALVSLTKISWLIITVQALVLIFAMWQTYFFRVPRRYPVGSSKIVTAPSDGKIVIAENMVECEHLKKECLQISTYMDFFDVHATFWPVSGTITYYKYSPGKHFFAFKPKASLENEHTCVCIRTPEGKDVVFKQIAGGFARRIVCYAEVGMEVKAGDQCGIIKFGSRTDVFCPVGTDLRVNLTNRVRSCETILAEL